MGAKNEKGGRLEIAATLKAQVLFYP